MLLGKAFELFQTLWCMKMVRGGLISGSSFPPPREGKIGFSYVFTPPQHFFGPFTRSLVGESGDRIQIFPEPFIGIDNHLITCAQVRFSVNNHRLPSFPTDASRRFERSRFNTVSFCSFLRFNTETVLQFHNDSCIKVFCHASFDGITLA